MSFFHCASSVRPAMLTLRFNISLYTKQTIGHHNHKSLINSLSLGLCFSVAPPPRTPIFSLYQARQSVSLSQPKLYPKTRGIEKDFRSCGLFCQINDIPIKLPARSYVTSPLSRPNILWSHRKPWSSNSLLPLALPCLNNSSNFRQGWSASPKASSSTVSSDDAIYKEVAGMIKSSASNILVMVGAGISTPSGIPDFRTPGTGLYDNLQKYNLPYPEAIFDIHYYMMDPRPFIALAQELYPGVNYKPNVVHYFLRLIFENQNLQKLYSQNIDGLERMAGIPGVKLMEAHGTFATASCTLCGKMHPTEEVKNAILSGDIPKCKGKKCKGKVKPDIVFFGENLPEQFWNYHNEVCFTDLLLVIGTSLEVYPFAGIADAVGRQTPRVLINREHVGSFGTRANDYMLLGDLETSVKRLVKEIGWEKKLKELTENVERT